MGYAAEALKPDVDPEVTTRLTNFYSQTFWCNIGAFKCTQALGREKIACVAVRPANPISLWSIAFASPLTTRLLGNDPSVSGPGFQLSTIASALGSGHTVAACRQPSPSPSAAKTWTASS